ncbi:hypothetical protein [uncultured Tateyamaria sp.]|uniref:hypothetical protein n=1 Tax=uncultured Tateyamaria sp. TaxID=455651 RepID=UPI00261FFBA4|nr:hypothetical protein [uncultured Tateyamaria sp.]
MKKTFLILAVTFISISVSIQWAKNVSLSKGEEFYKNILVKKNLITTLFGEGTLPSEDLHITDLSNVIVHEDSGVVFFDLSNFFDHMLGCPRKIFLVDPNNSGNIYKRYTVENCNVLELKVQANVDAKLLNSIEFNANFPTMSDTKILYDDRGLFHRTVVAATPYINDSGRISRVDIFLSQPPKNEFTKTYRRLFKGVSGPYYGSELSGLWGTFTP